MNLYIFKLEQFHIDNTRSRHQDTDTVAFALQVGSHLFSAQTFFAGDVNNGDHAVNLVFASVLINDDNSPAVFTYEIYNGDASKLPASLAAMASGLADQIIPLTMQTTGVDTGFANLSSGEAGQDVPKGWKSFRGYFELE